MIKKILSLLLITMPIIISPSTEQAHNSASRLDAINRFLTENKSVLGGHIWDAHDLLQSITRERAWPERYYKICNSAFLSEEHAYRSKTLLEWNRSLQEVIKHTDIQLSYFHGIQQEYASESLSPSISDQMKEIDKNFKNFSYITKQYKKRLQQLKEALDEYRNNVLNKQMKK